MVPFIRKWKLGCGFYGEQGAEGLHREFNKLSHGSISDPIKRLKSILKRHHINSFPKAQNEDLKPKVKSRGPYKRKRLVLEN